MPEGRRRKKRNQNYLGDNIIPIPVSQQQSISSNGSSSKSKFKKKKSGVTILDSRHPVGIKNVKPLSVHVPSKHL